MNNKPLLIILLSVGLVWFRSGLSKLLAGNFASNLGETLTKSVDKIPYPLFKQFLINIVIPNSQLFGNLVVWGEVLNGIVITVGVFLLLKKYYIKWARILLILGLVGGIFLNINYWLGFGSSPASDNLNLLMIAVQIIGIITLFKRNNLN